MAVCPCSWFYITIVQILHITRVSRLFSRFVWRQYSILFLSSPFASCRHTRCVHNRVSIGSQIGSGGGVTGVETPAARHGGEVEIQHRLPDEVGKVVEIEANVGISWLGVNLAAAPRIL